MRYLIGVDVGGSHVTCARVETESRQILRASVTRRHVDTNGPADQVMAVFAEAVLAAAGGTMEAIDGVGFAFPSPFDWENGICLITPEQNKFKHLYGVNIRKELQTRLHFSGKVAFLNDAACFAVGEYAAGASKGVSHALGITLGTGFGASFTLNGKPVTSGDSVPKNGGELWDVPYRSGIADDYFSTRGLIAAWKQISGEDARGAKEIADLAEQKGDARAFKVHEDFGTALAEFLSPWLLRFGVKTLVVGGSIGRGLNLFEKTLTAGLPQGVTVKPSLLGEDAQIVGAASAVQM